jgi:hypothetical protein
MQYALITFMSIESILIMYGIYHTLTLGPWTNVNKNEVQIGL